MRYEHTPRPEIEHHPYIKELIERQEKRTSDRNYHRNREKDLEERDALIKDARWLEVKDFWCEHCQKDFKAQEIKQIETDWSNPSQRIAFYKTKHKDCETWVIRFITDRWKDPYWYKSKRVRIDQGKHYNDTVQPHQTGFNLLYGRKNNRT